MTRRRRVWIGLSVAVVLVLAYVFTRHEVPAGQPPLVTLDVNGRSALRADFNTAASDTRIILLLSPT
jgi:hypothetical protein